MVMRNGVLMLILVMSILGLVLTERFAPGMPEDGVRDPCMRRAQLWFC